jgi:signal transduction histidine kinase
VRSAFFFVFFFGNAILAVPQLCFATSRTNDLTAVKTSTIESAASARATRRRRSTTASGGVGSSSALKGGIAPSPRNISIVIPAGASRAAAAQNARLRDAARRLPGIASTGTGDVIARAIVTDRSYACRVPPGGDDETGVLVDAFNTMVDEGESRITALEAEIAARGRAGAALRAAYRRKDEFLATVAHGLRNPSAPVRNAMRLLKSPNANDAQRAWRSQVIARQVGRMALLLDDLLDLSRITRGVLELRRETVDLASVVQAAVETAQRLEDRERALAGGFTSHCTKLVDPAEIERALKRSHARDSRAGGG